MITSDLFYTSPSPDPRFAQKTPPKEGVYVEGPLRASNLNFWIRKQTFSSGLGLIKHDAGEILNYFFLIIVIVLSPGIQITHVNSRIRTFFHSWTSNIFRQLAHLETFGDWTWKNLRFFLVRSKSAFKLKNYFCSTDSRHTCHFYPFFSFAIDQSTLF